MGLLTKRSGPVPTLAAQALRESVHPLAYKAARLANAAAAPDPGEVIMSIQSKLDALEAEFGPERSASNSAMLRKAIDELVAAEERDRPFKIGDVAPAFTLSDPNGARVSSVDLLRKGPLVVTFYRGLWCPYCQHDLLSFQAAMSDMISAGASVVAVSHRMGSGDSHAFRQANNFDFSVLEDDMGDVAVQFGIRWAPHDFRLIDERRGTNVGSFRGTEPWIIPMQARYVVRQDGVIAFAEVAFDYTQRTEPTEILAILGQLKRTS